MTTTEAPRAAYMELGILAEGGMALVMRAVRQSDGANVVVKRVRPPLCFDQGFLRLFRDEGALHSVLEHEHIVRLLDHGEDEQGPYLVFEHISGTDLGVLLERALVGDSSIDVELVLAVAVPVTAALAFVHDAVSDGRALNAVHRDVSPANVLLGDDGAVKLADFGVAASTLKTEVTVAGELKGKFAYMAPEQTRGGPVTPQADLFALGVVLWECLANRRLFEAPTDADVVQQVRHKEAPRLDGADVATRIDAALADLVAELLQKEPSLRPASAGQVHDRLMAMASERGLDDGLRRLVAQAVRQVPRRELSPIAPDVPLRRRTQRVVGLATADTIRRLPTAPAPRRRVFVGAIAVVVAVVAVLLLIPVSATTTATTPATTARVESVEHTLDPTVPTSASTSVQPEPIAPPTSPTSAQLPPPALHQPPPLPVAAPVRPRNTRPSPSPSPSSSAPVEGLGRLSITSEPWARVRIDGVEVARETPLIAFPVRAGRHQVVLENPVAGLSKHLVVDVGVDDHQRRFVDLQTP